MHPIFTYMHRVTSWPADEGDEKRGESLAFGETWRVGIRSVSNIKNNSLPLPRVRATGKRRGGGGGKLFHATSAAGRDFRRTRDSSTRGPSFSRTDRRRILKRVRNAALYVIKYTHARNIAPLATTDASMIVVLRREREGERERPPL